MDIKFAYNTLVYAGEDIAQGIARLKKYGYDGVDFVGEPATMDAKNIKTLLTQHDIEASSICAVFDAKRNLVSSKKEIRDNTVQYIKDCVDFACAIRATKISVSATTCNKIHPEAESAQEWEWGVCGLRDAGQYALDHGIKLTLEAWNRYETYLINRLEQSLAMVNDVDLPSVGCMGDTFHMNIEEPDMAEAIRKTGDKLYYMHFADSNRAAPGRGHIDFAPVVQAMKEIGYTGYVSFELLPAAADPFMVLNGTRCDEFYDQYTEESVTYLKKLFYGK